MDKKFYITTPIYYVNDIPHIGHAYTTIAADVLARRNRLAGNEVFFLTGTDEHGQKVEKAAAEKGRSPKEQADLMVKNFKGLWKRLGITNDAFIRTTDPEHIRTVQGLLQMLWDRSEIEKREYSGWYCTPDERFWTEKDLKEGNCPDCGRPVEQIHEENYFFLMSKYQDRLIRYINENPAYILPETRRNEVLGFLTHNTLGDLCISRPKERLSWGISLPFDDRFVTYVWFDALVNYFSATRYLAPNAEKAKEGNFWWPASYHLVGKDILTTHAVYWSTMLMALDLPLPGNIFAHGWWTVKDRKMSKSLGNMVDPNLMAERYGVDAFRYFLLREVPFGLDGDFSEETLVHRINTDLANDLGNLLSRSMTMAEKYTGGIIEFIDQDIPTAAEHKAGCLSAALEATNEDLWAHLRFNLILERIWDIIRVSNNYIARTEPWKLAKTDMAAVKGVMFSLWNSLRMVSAMLYPFMPSTAERIWIQLGLRSLTEEARKNPKIAAWDWRPSYPVIVTKGEQLFPRIERKKEEKNKMEQDQKPDAGEGTNLITIQDFMKVELKTGKIISAERVHKSEKLIKLQVDTGEPRQIVAGIGKTYSPEDLIGKTVIVVANLQPAKLMGNESQGMLLAATGSDGIPVILIPEKNVEPGAKIK